MSKRLIRSITHLKTNLDCYNLDRQYSCHNYSVRPIAFTHGKGLYLYDVNGTEYIDLFSAATAANQGHCHPKIQAAIMEQARKLTLTSRAFYNNKLGDFERKLTEMFGYDKVCLMNTGTEAMDTAIKFARRWAYNVKGVEDGKARVLFAYQNYWGRSIAGAAASEEPIRRANFGPMNGFKFDFVEFNNLQNLEQKFIECKDYAAFMVEPIQGDGGVNIPHQDYLKKAQALCKKYNVLFVVDEIQTGCGRSGKLTASEIYGVRPDMIAIGKSLAGGYYPVSGVLADDEIMLQIKYIN